MTSDLAAGDTDEPVCHSTDVAAAGSAASVQRAGRRLQHLRQDQVQLDRPVQQQQCCQ